MIAKELSELVMDDLDGRSGILDEVDAEVQEEMRRELESKINDYLEKNVHGIQPS